MERIERKDIITDDAAEVFVKLAGDIEKSTEAMTRLIKTAQTLGKEMGGAKDLDEFNKATKQAGEATQKLSAEQKEYEKVLKAIEAQKAKLALAQSEEVKQLNELKQKTKDMTNAVQSEADSISDLNKRNAELRKQRNAISTATEDGRKKIAAINKQIDENTAKVRANSDAITKQKMNIGNYKSALEGLPGPLGNIASSAMNMGKQLWAAVSNPVVLAIVAVTGAVVALYKAFTATDAGATMLESRMKELKSSFKILRIELGELTQGFAKNGEESVKWGSITATALKILAGAANVIPAVRNKINDLEESMNNASSAANDYTYAMDALNDKMIRNISYEKQLETEIARLETIAQDRTKTDKERADALESAIAKEKELFETQLAYTTEAYNESIKMSAKQYGVEAELLDAYISAGNAMASEMEKNNTVIANMRNNMNDDEARQLEELYVKKFELETKYQEAIKRSTGRLSGLYVQIENEKVKVKAVGIDEESAMLAAAHAEWEDATWAMIENEQKMKQEARDKELKENEEFQNALTDQLIQANNDRIEQERIAAEERKAVQEESSNTIMEGLNALSGLYEANKQRELSAAGDNAKKREQIEREYLRKQQNLAIADALMRAAQGAVRTLSRLGLPLATPFLLAQAAFTAIQIRTIKAQKFFKGTDHSPEGLAWVGEQGKELVIDPSGNVGLTPDKATLTYLRKGTKVIPNRKTEKILADRDYTPLLSKIADKPQVSVNIDSAGISVMTRSATTVQRRVDKYFRT